MVTSNNYTIYGIHNNSERYFWASFHLIVFSSSLIGDILILYATSRKNAFKLNKFIVTVLQYIAVADLLYSVIAVLPAATALIANRWILGDAICYARVYLSYYIYLAGMSFIAVLTTTKFLILKNPIRSTSWTKKRAHIVCCLSMLPHVTLPVLMLALSKDNIAFDFKTYTCVYLFQTKIWLKLVPVLSILTMIVPNIIIVVTTILTLKVAWKSAARVQKSAPWQGALTVALTAAVYCISTLPLSVYHIGEQFVEDRTGPYHVRFLQIAFFLCMINTMANFYIYILTIRSFRRFIFSVIVPKVFYSFTTSSGNMPTSSAQQRANVAVSVESVSNMAVQQRGNMVELVELRVEQHGISV